MDRDEEDDESEEDKEKGTFNLALKSRVQSWSKVIYIFAYFSISLGAPPYEQLATLVEQSAALVQEPTFFWNASNALRGPGAKRSAHNPP
jgi:hypothetical protein